MTLLARTGRHRQRYDDDRRRLVAGCIPYRVRQNVEDQSVHLVHRLEVLMISSPNRDDLVFPKGGWENDETVHEAACREALEEAGVSGIIHKECLGVWDFRSKSRQNSCSLEGSCRGYMFALQVMEELDSWAEETCHKRRWVPASEAKSLCRYPWMGEALENCIGLLTQAAVLPSEPQIQSLDGTMDALITSPLEAFCRGMTELLPVRQVESL